MRRDRETPSEPSAAAMHPDGPGRDGTAMASPRLSSPTLPPLQAAPFLPSRRTAGDAVPLPSAATHVVSTRRTTALQPSPVGQEGKGHGLGRATVARRCSPAPAPSPVGAAGMRAPGPVVWAGKGQQLPDGPKPGTGGLAGDPLPAPARWMSPPSPQHKTPVSPWWSPRSILPIMFAHCALWSLLRERSRAGLSSPRSSPSPAAHHCGIRPPCAHFHLPPRHHRAASALLQPPCMTQGLRILAGPAPLPTQNTMNTLLRLKQGGLRCHRRRGHTDLAKSRRGSRRLNTRPALPGRLVGADPINCHPGRCRSRGNGFGWRCPARDAVPCRAMPGG